MQRRKIISLILILFIVCHAAAVISDEDRPTVYVDYLGRAEAGGPNALKSHPKLIEEGQVFWIGVGITNMDKAEHDFFQNGIYNIEFGFDYDPQYIIPAQDTAASWLDDVEAFNITDAMWHGDDYEIVRDACGMDLEPDEDVNRESTPPDGWKMAFVSIMKKSAAENRFTGIDDSGKHYVLKLPFEVVSLPPEETSPTVLKISKGPQTLVIGGGADGTDPYGQWEAVTETSIETNLNGLEEINGVKGILDFDADIDLYTPAPLSNPFTVLSYDPKKAITVSLYNGEGELIETGYEGPAWIEGTTTADDEKIYAAAENEHSGAGPYFTVIDLAEAYPSQNLAPGDYELRLEKAGSLTVCIKITIPAGEKKLGTAQGLPGEGEWIYLPAGDINPSKNSQGGTVYGDGRIDMADLAALRRYNARAVTKPAATDEEKLIYIADIDGDGYVTMADNSILLSPQNYGKIIEKP